MDLLDAASRGAGLLAVADISTTSRRTALAGNATLIDALIVCAGAHRDQDAPRLSNGEYPACAAMTTGYVFRVENEAMVHYLQRVGRTGQLTTLTVQKQDKYHASSPLVLLCATVTVLATACMVQLQDWTAVCAVVVYCIARLINVLVIRQRAVMGWKGQQEPGVLSDLLVLLSQDRWVRMRGLTDDMKAATSGEWLRQPTFNETLLVTLSTMLLYLNVGMVAGATFEARMILTLLFSVTTMLIETANGLVVQLQMHGRTIKIHAPRRSYARRLDLAEELVKEVGRHDWCEKMGMVNAGEGSWSKGPVHM